MYCFKCGEVIPDNSSSCNYCGATQQKQQYKQVPPPQQRMPAAQQKKQGSSPILVMGAIFFGGIVLLIALFGRGGSSNNNNTSNKSQTVTTKAVQTVPVTTQPKTEPTTEAKPKTNVTMTGHHLTQNSLGDNILVIEYDFYNGEDEPKSFIWSATAKCYQNGIELDDWTIGVDEVDAHKQSADVQPGVTNHLAIGYILEDMSDVNIVVEKYLGKEQYINETFSPQE